jgi:uncharacterized membrane protein YphA (DoxX/SURF4 family)
MNSVMWVAQILLAGVFLYAGFSKIFVSEGRPKELPSASIFGCIGLPHGLAAAIAVLEIAGAVCLVMPIDLWPPDILPRLAAAGLALLVAAIGAYHARRREPTAPLVAVFLLAIFVIVGRWPQ